MMGEEKDLWGDRNHFPMDSAGCFIYNVYSELSLAWSKTPEAKGASSSRNSLHLFLGRI